MPQMYLCVCVCVCVCVRERERERERLIMGFSLTQRKVSHYHTQKPQFKGCQSHSFPTVNRINKLSTNQLAKYHSSCMQICSKLGHALAD